MRIRNNTVNVNVQHIRQSILPILRRYGVSKAGLFGSVVSNQMLPESDIDILVQIDKDISLLDFVGMKLELEQALNRSVDLVEYDTIKPLLRETILRQQETIL
jgi:predicted nucleotidyltransferase